MTIGIVLGTRPEIIKFSPVIRACQERDIEFKIIHSGQHYSENLSGDFFDRLELPRPDYDLEVGSGRQGEQSGEIIKRMESTLLDVDPEIVLVQGDTNTTMAGAIATSKLGPKLGHVEAGLRSYDWSMPEEINRKITDHISNKLFVPTETARKTVLEEGIPEERIFLTGNTIVDAVEQNRTIARTKSTVHSELGLEPGQYFLLTAHRQENVDDPTVLSRILDGVARVSRLTGDPVIYPIHPRASKVIDRHGIEVPIEIKVIDPVSFLDFLRLENNAKIIITDSGGVQEESCILQTPCVTIRTTTERPETVEVGANVLAGTGPEQIKNAAQEMLNTGTDWENPFGDGTAAEKILDTI